MTEACGGANPNRIAPVASEANRWVTPATVALAVVAALVLIGGNRAALLSSFLRIKSQHDTYALPKPEHVVTMSLGYRSALADLLFAHTLVQSGIHLAEKRRFEIAGDYLRTVNALDPRFATPYRFTDTILTLQTTKPTLTDYQSARAILEHGMNEFPFDTSLWISAGQFLAYLAPPHVEKLAGLAVAKEWREQGARRLMRSCELVGSGDNVPRHCISASKLLTQAGEFDALEQFIGRVVATSDDPEVRAEALAVLSRATDKQRVQKMRARLSRYDSMRRRSLAFLSRDRYLLLEPDFDVFDCLDAHRGSQPRCATTFGEYHRRLDELED